MVLMVGTFSQPGISKQQAEELKKEIAELKELVNSKHTHKSIHIYPKSICETSNVA